MKPRVPKRVFGEAHDVEAEAGASDAATARSFRLEKEARQVAGREVSSGRERLKVAEQELAASWCLLQEKIAEFKRTYDRLSS
jgi:hypothetical protein